MGRSTDLPLLMSLKSLPDMLTTKDVKGLLQIDRKTIYGYVQKGLTPYLRIESNVRFSKHRVRQWLEERSFQPRPVNAKAPSASKISQKLTKPRDASRGFSTFQLHPSCA